MRSRWVVRLFGPAERGGAGSGKPQANAPACKAMGKDSRTGQADRAFIRSSRICLGIGDGTVHRQ